VFFFERLDIMEKNGAPMPTFRVTAALRLKLTCGV
jgi:hypothetical protein